MNIRNKFLLVNFITMLRFVFLGFFVYWASQDEWLTIFLLAPFVFLTDKLDGHLARKWEVVSNFGKVVDPLADKALTLVLLYIILDFYQFEWVYVGLAALMILFDISVIFMSASARNKSGEIIEPTKAGKYRMAVYMSSIAIMFSGIVFRDAGSLGDTLRFLGLSLFILTAVLTVYVFRQYLSMYLAESRRIASKLKDQTK